MACAASERDGLTLEFLLVLYCVDFGTASNSVASIDYELCFRAIFASPTFGLVSDFLTGLRPFFDLVKWPSFS